MARPREFDVDRATEAALKLFWSRGYEGTTIGDLTEALGVNRPSLYAAFGSKEGLFRKALERYLTGPGACVARALEAKTARQAVERLLRIYVDATGEPDRPKGCLLVNGAIVCGDGNAPIRQALAEQRGLAEQALTDRLERAKAEGDLPASEKSADLARYIWVVCHGLSVRAVSGATREELRRVAQLALRAWPSR